MKPSLLAGILALAVASPGAMVVAAEPAGELRVLCSVLAKPAVAELVAPFEATACVAVRIE